MYQFMFFLFTCTVAPMHAELSPVYRTIDECDAAGREFYEANSPMVVISSCSAVSPLVPLSDKQKAREVLEGQRYARMKQAAVCGQDDDGE